MKIIFGYACQSTLFPHLKAHNTSTLTYIKQMKTDKQKAAYIKSKAAENLKNLPLLLKKNAEQGIYAFRISDDLIPMADLGLYDFALEFKQQLKQIGALANSMNMYLSYHPSQFFLLTSQNPKVIETSIRNFNIFAKVLSLMELKNKPVLLTHVGAVKCYSNWEEACDAFCENFKKMSNQAQEYFAVQNDQTSHSINSCMYIHAKLGIPVVFDHAHYHWNPVKNISMAQAVAMSMKTWKDRTPKVHLCSQAAGKNVHAHSDEILPQDFLQLRDDVEKSGVKQAIFMVQVKNKDGAIKRLLQKLEPQNIYA